MESVCWRKRDGERGAGSREESQAHFPSVLGGEPSSLALLHLPNPSPEGCSRNGVLGSPPPGEVVLFTNTVTALPCYFTLAVSYNK